MSATVAFGNAEAQAILHYHARSFAWAARLLPAATRSDAARLYAFCRTIDDLADNAPAEQAHRRLAAVRMALEAGDDSDPVARVALDLAARRSLPVEAAVELVAGVHGDLDRCELATTADLVRYAYRVAGTVGLMMRPLLGARDPAADPYAVDLGIAMQLTNIARDVVEDAERGRRYLPDDLLGAAVRPERLLAPDPGLREDGFAAIRQLLRLADRYYASGEQGMVFLPRRSRLGILVAGRIYRAIGDRILALGPDTYWRTRASVSAATKTRLTAAAGAEWLRARRGARAVHDPRLHEPITGWPGSDPAASG